jgi:hypothetical protein
VDEVAFLYLKIFTFFVGAPEIESFETSPPEGEIIESNTTTFTCSVDTRPGADIKLLGLDGQPLESVSDFYELRYDLRNVGCVHSGKYTCWTKNKKTEKEMEQSLEIKVKCWFICALSDFADSFPLLGSPSLATWVPEDRIQGVVLGDSTFFYVEALTHPAAQFQWRRVFDNGTHINLPSDSADNSSRLTFHNVAVHDFGNYSVSAFNSIGRWGDVTFELRSQSK